MWTDLIVIFFISVLSLAVIVFGAIICELLRWLYLDIVDWLKEQLEKDGLQQ